MNLFGVEQEVTTSDDYLTPPWVFEALGVSFDLDVAASPFGGHVPARRSLTMADDGLVTPWEGRVWMNPPYHKPAPWVRLFIAHRNGIALLPMSKSQWTVDLWNTADGLAVCPFFDFIGGSIFIPTYFAAFGGWAVEAIGRVGHVR